MQSSFEKIQQLVVSRVGGEHKVERRRETRIELDPAVDFVELTVSCVYIYIWV